MSLYVLLTFLMGMPAAMPLSQPTAVGARTVHIRADRASIGMGKSVVVAARVTASGGTPAANVELWPYVNGRRWGAQAVTDRGGRAVFFLPLPRPGLARIQAIVRPVQPTPDARWIWAAETTDNQVAYFYKRFVVSGPIRAASLRITCDDAFRTFLNGQEVAGGGSFQIVRHVSGLERWLKPGENVLAVEGRNGVGPAGLLARLEIQTGAGAQVVATDASWEVYVEKPAGWPGAVRERGRAARELAPVGGGVWGSALQGWPGLSPRSDFPVGLSMPEGTTRSNTVIVRVSRRAISRIARDPQHLVGLEWEPWFTPRNARWDTAEAVPLLGNYDSFNTDVIRQHALWMAEAGIDFLLVDWSNNLWDKRHWNERAPGVDELIRGTTLLLDTYAQMRREGVPVPQVTLLLGLDNGPQTTTTALNEEMRWVYARYVRPPRYRGLWVEYEGKPLIVVFNGGGPGIRQRQPPLEESQFTVRWMASQLQVNHLERAGYWSWMDGVLHPVITYHSGRAEALTITPAYFGDGGWTYPQARGRRGGTTYLEQWQTAIQARPRFLLINQWNEFAGQPEGSGYGPRKDQYVDCYNVELSNDIEPTSLTACAYRGCGGWGYTYLNLTRAAIRLYHGQAPETTLLALASPQPGAAVSGPTLRVEWAALGAPARGFTLRLDGKDVARNVPGSAYTLDIRRLAAGRHRLTLLAEGVVTRFPLSAIREAEPLAVPIPASVQVEFQVARRRPVARQARFARRDGPCWQPTPKGVGCVARRRQGP
ncbi:MAG TPA: hypothetical protein VFB38_04925 [Chthonomonadaceae bacterium]|nr:hypothetical protein [Chthonomonadaceae bacterium]